MKKIAIYCRVSTEEQKIKGISLHDQKQRGIEFCKRKNYKYEVFEDGGISGEDPIEKRPELNRLIEKILSKPQFVNGEMQNEFAGIYVIELDRLSRNTKVTRFIKETLIENKVKLFISDGSETNFEDPNDNLMFEFKSLLSEYENKKTRVRIKDALKRNAIDGKVGGGKLINYGYTKDENKKLIVEETESKVVKLIYKLCLEGKGTKVIANLLNENQIPTKREIVKAPMKVKGENREKFKWRDSVVYNILTNPLYKGQRKFKGEFYPAPKIVDENIFDTIQDILSKRKNHKNTTNKYFYLLKGLIFCGKCGSRMYGRKRKDLSDNQYICSSQRYKGEFCGNRGINIDKIEDIIINSILRLPSDYQNYIKRAYTDLRIKSQLKSLELYYKMKTKLEKEIENLLLLYSSNLKNKNQVVNLVNIKNKEIEELNNIINKTEHKMQGKKIDENLQSILYKLSLDLESNKKNKEKSKNILTGIVEKIHVGWYNDTNPYHHVKIQYKFDEKTGVKISKSLDVNYLKSGFAYRFKNLKNEVILSVYTPNPRLLGTDGEKEDSFYLLKN